MPIVNNSTDTGSTNPSQNRKLCLNKEEKILIKADTKTVSARISDTLKSQLENKIKRINSNKNDAITDAIILYLGLDEAERSRRLNGQALSVLIAIRSDINRAGNLFALEVKKTGKVDQSTYDELKNALKKIQEIALNINELRTKGVL